MTLTISGHQTSDFEEVLWDIRGRFVTIRHKETGIQFDFPFWLTVKSSETSKTRDFLRTAVRQAAVRGVDKMNKAKLLEAYQLSNLVKFLEAAKFYGHQCGGQHYLYRGTCPRCSL